MEPTNLPLQSTYHKVNLDHLETTSISVHLPLVVVALLNELGKRLGVNQTTLTRAGTILLLETFKISEEEGAAYTSLQVIAAITKAAGANTAFPDNFEELIIDLFPEKQVKEKENDNE